MPELGRKTRERYRRIIDRFAAYEYGCVQELKDRSEDMLATLYTKSEAKQAQFRDMMHVMKGLIDAKERHWWKLPLHAYEGDLVFRDGDALRNVPLRKKRQKVPRLAPSYSKATA